MLAPDDLVLPAHTVGNPPLDVLVEAARAGGFAGVTMWLPYLDQLCADGLTPAEVGRRLAGEGLGFLQLEAAQSWTLGREGRAAASDEEEVVLGAAAAVGAEGVLAVTMAPTMAPLDEVVEAFGALCDRAADRDLTVQIEFLPWSAIPDLATALRIVEQADRPNGGLVIDAWHTFRGGVSLPELAAAPGERIFGIQIDDAPLRAAADLVDETMRARLVPGEGELDLVAWVRALDATGTRATYSPEVMNEALDAGDPVATGRRVGDATRAVLAAARS